jgi:hypothetical protein
VIVSYAAKNWAAFKASPFWKALNNLAELIKLGLSPTLLAMIPLVADRIGLVRRDEWMQLQAKKGWYLHNVTTEQKISFERAIRSGETCPMRQSLNNLLLLGAAKLESTKQGSSNSLLRLTPSCRDDHPSHLVLVSCSSNSKRVVASSIHPTHLTPA